MKANERLISRAKKQVEYTYTFSDSMPVRRDDLGSLEFNASVEEQFTDPGKLIIFVVDIDAPFPVAVPVGLGLNVPQMRVFLAVSPRIPDWRNYLASYMNQIAHHVD